MAFSDNDIYRIFQTNSQPQIQRFLHQRIRCQDTAADFDSGSYLRLMLLKLLLSSEIEVRAWLFTVASNLSIDHIPTQKRHPSCWINIWAMKTKSTTRPRRSGLQMRGNSLWQIQSALAATADQCAEILYLSWVEGLSDAQIARQLAISTSWGAKSN